MNTRLAYKTLSLGFLFSAAAFGQSNTSTMDLPSFKWNRLKDYVSADLFYTHDYISSTGGEKAGPRNIGALDIYFESDMSKYSSVPGEMMFHFIHINQNDTRASIGDAQGASNIDMPTQVDRVVDLWYQHNFTDKFKTLAGLHDISMEFNVTESSLNFLNSSFGTSAELAGAGPSLYPITSLGARAQFMFTDELSLKTGIYDSAPGDESTYRSFHSDVGNQNGYMHISEVAHQTDDQKAGVAFWNHTKSQQRLDISGDEATSYGTYGMYERKLNHSMWAFARLGWANPQVSAIQSNAATGVVYRGIFQRKKTLDEAGVGLSRVHFSRHVRDTAEFDGIRTVSGETAYEAYYNFKPMKILSLRPDVQYITKPSGNADAKDAFAVGFRSVVEL